MAKKASKKEEKKMLLSDVLWNCRNALRGVGSTEKNRDAVIGLTFLKFASNKFEKKRQEIIEKYGDVPAFLEKDSFYRSDNVFYLPEHTRWSYIKANASKDNIATILDEAMKELEERNEPLAGALLRNNFFVTLGADKSSLKKLIDEIDKINPETYPEEEDLIGRVYEYFLQAYAVAAKKEDGEFYTPACIVQLIAELIEPYSGTVYDPCCGSGGMFVQSLKFVDKHKGNRKQISVLGQESNPDTWRLCKMNLAIRGIAHDLGQKNASTFTEDQHKDKTVNYIMANPPFNLKNWRGEDELINDPRWSAYNVPRSSNANYAWILHMLSKLDVNNGIAGFLLANGALNDEDEYENRKKLIENDKVEAIIVLPRDMFYTTDISVTLWILNNNKKAGTVNGRKVRSRKNEILFVDLRTWNENIESYKLDKGTKKKVVLSEQQIEKVKDIYFKWQSEETDGTHYEVPELYCSVGLEEIKEKNFALTPSKYIEFIDHDLDIDYEKEMTRIQNEMKEIMVQEEKSQQMLKEAFEGIGYGITKN